MSKMPPWLRRSKARGPRSPNMPAPAIQVDAYAKNPVISPVDGKPISSRAELRAHNERNGVVDVGNDKAALRQSAPSMPSERAIAETLATNYDRFDSGDPKALKQAKSGRRAKGDVRTYG